MDELGALLEVAGIASVAEGLIVLAYRGSIAHGMYLPGQDPFSVDDKDLMGVVVPPLDHYVGLKSYGSSGTLEIKRGEWDTVLYEAVKFIRLLSQGNPNVLSLLWLPPVRYLWTSPAGELLIHSRDLFAGKHVYNSFVGYAHGQLHRMEHGAFEGYVGEKRRHLFEQLGYDAKNAAHCIRLLRMGVEYLKDGVLRVDRTDLDAEELITIKRGGWSLENVKAEADRLFALAQEARDSSPLPDRPDAERINNLCVGVVLGALKIRRERERRTDIRQYDAGRI